MKSKSSEGKGIKEQTHKPINFGNPLINLAGNCYCVKKPSNKKILEELLNSMADFNGTCWNLVEEIKNGEAISWQLMLNQCPGACGYVWKLIIKDKNVCNWLVNEVNKRRQLKRR